MMTKAARKDGEREREKRMQERDVATSMAPAIIKSLKILPAYCHRGAREQRVS